jgi:hypothetical protein
MVAGEDMAAVQFTVTGKAESGWNCGVISKPEASTMGNEPNGAVRVARDRHEGRILLESSEIIFRSKEFRLRVPFGEICRVSAENGELHVVAKNGPALFEVGSAAEKWRDKILHPKSRIEKLGVRAGTRVRLGEPLPRISWTNSTRVIPTC